MKFRWLVLLGVACLCYGTAANPWGFYAHREINRLAVFTLPAKLARFYKPNIAYVSAHAVDPDKRRYAARLEGARHFIDLERFGDGTMSALPNTFWEFHDKYTTVACEGEEGSVSALTWDEDYLRLGADSTRLYASTYGGWYRSSVLPAYYREDTKLDITLPQSAIDSGWVCESLTLIDTMMEHGVLPYNLVAVQRRLTDAFRQNDQARALQLSAELGHYIGDATVPLHTTENYNGQFTGQRGIHAFWESRIPELFAEAEFDVLVGRAAYIDDITQYYRDIVEESHALVDSVLLIEADLRRTVAEEKQDCYEERLGQIVRVPCRAFARQYYLRLDGMVQARFRRAILAVGSAWYTAWVDGGSPTLEAGTAIMLPQDSSYVSKRGAEGRGH